MKKRILYVLLSSLILCSCGHEQSASDKALTNAKKAYEIGQNYLSGDISAEDAQEQLENIEENISYASDYSYDERKMIPRSRLIITYTITSTSYLSMS